MRNSLTLYADGLPWWSWRRPAGWESCWCRGRRSLRNRSLTGTRTPSGAVSTPEKDELPPATAAIRLSKTHPSLRFVLWKSRTFSWRLHYVAVDVHVVTYSDEVGQVNIAIVPGVPRQ